MDPLGTLGVGNRVLGLPVGGCSRGSELGSVTAGGFRMIVGWFDLG